MINKSEIAIIIPAYNETDSINVIIKSLTDTGFDNIILVDDGSKVPVSTFVNSTKSVHVIRHIINRGQGAALQTGHEYASKLGVKYVVHFDADGQHDFKEILPMVEELINTNKDILIGTRFTGKNNKSNVPLKKQIALRIGILFSFFLSSQILTDVHNGFRVIKFDSLQKFKISMDRFEHASEIIDMLSKKSVKYKEYPVTITYTDETIKKGQRLSNSINIVINSLLDKLSNIY